MEFAVGENFVHDETQRRQRSKGKRRLISEGVHVVVMSNKSKQCDNL